MAEQVTDMKNMDRSSVLEEINACKKELFNLKLSAAVGQVKDTSQFKKLRRKIARGLTVLKQKETGVTHESK